MRTLKILCGLFCLLVLASNVWSMSRWNEARGVYDDVCYLRQAHLFQRFGLAGFDTDISRDDDRYLASKLKEIAFPGWRDISTAPCHTLMPAANKLVMQYPPGTGLVLASMVLVEYPEAMLPLIFYTLVQNLVAGCVDLYLSRKRTKGVKMAPAGVGPPASSAA